LNFTWIPPAIIEGRSIPEAASLGTAGVSILRNGHLSGFVDLRWCHVGEVYLEGYGVSYLYIRRECSLNNITQNLLLQTLRLKVKKRNVDVSL
jgi:hypothetical protein